MRPVVLEHGAPTFEQGSGAGRMFRKLCSLDEQVKHLPTEIAFPGLQYLTKTAISNRWACTKDCKHNCLSFQKILGFWSPGIKRRGTQHKRRCRGELSEARASPAPLGGEGARTVTLGSGREYQPRRDHDSTSKKIQQNQGKGY